MLRVSDCSTDRQKGSVFVYSRTIKSRNYASLLIDCIYSIYQNMTNNESNPKTKAKTRLTLHQLKMENLDKHVPLLHREYNQQAKTIVKRPNLISKGPIKLLNTRAHLQRGCLFRSLQLPKRNQEGKQSHINKILLDIATLRQTVTRCQQYESSQIGEQRLASHFSTRLSYSRPKADKKMSSKYYRQIEVMKEIKIPIISQKVISISQLHSQPVSLHKQLLECSTSQREKPKKKHSLPFTTLQKYQITQQKEDILIPHELQTKRIGSYYTQQKEKILVPRELYAKKIGSRYAIESMGGETKNKIRFRFDSKLHSERRRYKKLDQKGIVEYCHEKIEGWQSDNYMMLQQLDG